ncbi:Terminase small subunit [anaerobic digester metagenome]
MTHKQQRFVEEYLIDLNATQAAIRTGYSPKTANEQGARLLANVSISSAVAVALAERSKRTGINADRIIQELAKLAFVNPTDVINMESASIKSDASRDDTAAIASVKVKITPTEDGYITEREVKTYDKIRALELLGKHVGLYTDKQDINLNSQVTFVGENEIPE